MNFFFKLRNKDGVNNYSTNPINTLEEVEVGDDETTLNDVNINGVHINDVNINDIHREEDISGNEKTSKVENHNNNNNYNNNNNNYNNNNNNYNNNNNNKKKKKKIEYVFYDVESLHYDFEKNDNILDLSSIKTESIFENKKKRKKKKEILKKKIKLFKKKYKILPEHNLDNDATYEQTTKNLDGSSQFPKKKRKKKKEAKVDSDHKKIKHIFSFKNKIFFDVLKMIVLISSIFSLGAFSTTVTKYIFFVEKFDYAHIIAFFQFLIMYLILRAFIFCFKMKSSTDLTKKDYIKYIISISTLLGVDTITGNSAFTYLEIPLITVFKSSSLILIYLLSVKFGLKKLRCSLLCSILTILAGTMMSISTLKISSAFGLLLLIVSVVSSAFKWVFTNVLLKTTSIKPHVILLHIYQVALLIILVPSILIDASKIANDYKKNAITSEQILTTMTLLTLGSLTNIFLILAELFLISLTSSVTLSIIGVGKEIVMLIIGAVFFGEKFGLNSAIGIGISMIGTILYGYASK